MNINIEKWKNFIEDESEYSIDAGYRHDYYSFLEELDESSFSLDWSLFPLEEIVSRKWVVASKKDLKKKPQQIFESFIGFLGGEEIPQNVLLRKTFHKNTKKLMNDYALLAWTIRVVSKAFSECCPQIYNPDLISKEFLTEVAQLSQYEDGPVRAKQFLADFGIALIIEKSLSGTIFNGAAIPTKRGNPIIGLTLHYDRIDNFWFTLLHELVHVWKHFDDDNELYIDYFGTGGNDNNDAKEDEANSLAREALIPKASLMHNAFIFKTGAEVEDLAKQLRVNPAIIAGRIQYDSRIYNILREYVDVPVRSFFNDVDWN